MLEIPEAEVRARLEAESPWWSAEWPSGQPSGLWPRAYLTGFLSPVRDVSVRRAVVLLGPRRVGKTVLIHHAVGALLQDGVPARRIGYLSGAGPLGTGGRRRARLDLLR